MNSKERRPHRRSHSRRFLKEKDSERIKMPKRGVNWANSKFLCNN